MQFSNEKMNVTVSAGLSAVEYFHGIFDCATANKAGMSQCAVVEMLKKTKTPYI